MSKMKKLLAMFLALAMVLGMSVTTFAAEAPAATASITIDGLTPNDGTDLTIYQIVALDVENSTWKIVNNDYANYVNLTATPITINWDGLKNSGKLVAKETKENVQTTTCTFDNLEVGAYLIIAQGDTTTYNVMGDGTYDYDSDNHLIIPVSKKISAKGSGYEVVKRLQNANQAFVAKGDTVVFDIETVFPSYPDDQINRTFTITDTPTGMKVTNVAVYVEDMNNALTLNTHYTVSTLGVADQAVTVTFTEDYIGTENEHATEAVKVEVTAVVTSDNAYSNSATSNFDSDPFTVNGDVGSLTITKTDENGNVLKGAKFQITLNGTVLRFAPSTTTPGEYVLVSGGTTSAETDVILVESPESGIIKITGLGEGTYKITEEQAPTGYSKVSVEDVTIKEGEVADATITVVNTKLIELPHTGGIGTTIFTVAGCGIMIAAAYLFFNSRKREEA